MIYLQKKFTPHLIIYIYLCIIILGEDMDKHFTNKIIIDEDIPIKEEIIYYYFKLKAQRNLKNKKEKKKKI